MKKINWVLVCVALSLFMDVYLYVTTVAQTQDGFKPALSSEQLEKIKEIIKNSQDVISLDPDNKGTFSWWGYLEYAGLWDFYYLTCGEGDLIIYLNNIPEGSDYDLYLFDCNGVELASSRNPSNGDEIIIMYVTTNLYWIGVYCFSGGNAGLPYHLFGSYVTPPKLPDLILWSLTASDYSPTIGEEITLTLTVKNQGDTIAEWFWTDLFLDEIIPPSVPSTGDYYWMTPQLNPGETVQFTQRVTNNESETWHMYGLTDSDGDLSEKNECNNLYGPVDINWTTPGAPDLIVQSLTVSNSNPYVDDNINVTMVIKNQGTGSASSFWNGLFYDLSSPPTIYRNF